MIYCILAMIFCMAVGVPLVIWFDKAKKELEEADKQLEQEDENEEDYQ